jgi:hypothetical protein
MRPARLLLAVVLGAAACGCASEDPYRKYPVTVIVTLDGKPMADGAVLFVARDGRGTYGTDIKDGTAQFDSVAGAMRVEFGVYRLPPGMKQQPQGALDFRVNALPERYHVNSELSAEVGAKGPNEFKFELTSK